MNAQIWFGCVWLAPLHTHSIQWPWPASAAPSPSSSASASFRSQSLLVCSVCACAAADKKNFRGAWITYISNYCSILSLNPTYSIGLCLKIYGTPGGSTAPVRVGGSSTPPATELGKVSVSENHQSQVANKAVDVELQKQLVLMLMCCERKIQLFHWNGTADKLKRTGPWRLIDLALVSLVPSPAWPSVCTCNM